MFDEYSIRAKQVLFLARLESGGQRQTLCFSATMEQSVAGLVTDYMRNPVRVALGSVLKPAETVQLKAFEVRPGEKLDVLRQLLYAEKGQTLIFTRTKRGTERLAKELVRDGFAAAMIHGDRSQSQRNGALSGFQAGRFQVLVATDIASRGLHVDDVAHVINYDVPKVAEDFIHRVGRTGRAGLQGRAPTLAAGAEVLELRQIERALKLKMERLQIDRETTAPSRRNDPKHASLADPDEVAGRSVCLELRICLPERYAPAIWKRRLFSGYYSRRVSFEDEPSLRIFFRARFRAKALFTRRFSPGFK